MNINGERTILPTAVPTHLPPWLLSSYVGFLCFFSPFCYLCRSFHFLPARCLTKHSAPFLHCAAFPHFLSLSASSRCLIHQHLLKLCVVLCINVLCPMSVSLHMQKSWKKVHEIMWESHTFGTLLSQTEAWGRAAHFWHAARPRTSVRKEHGWQNRRCHGGGSRAAPRQQKQHSSQMCCPRACTSQGQVIPHRWQTGYVTWKKAKAKF